MSIFADNMYPITLEPYMGPIMWTPIAEDEIVVSKEVVYYNWADYKYKTLSEPKLQAMVITGCPGGSPRAIDIAWSEPGVAGTGGAGGGRAFAECILTDALTMSKLMDVFASAYCRDGRLPPAGMTLRCILSDPLARRVRLEFKSREEALAEAAASADAAADVVCADAPKKCIGPAAGDYEAFARMGKPYSLSAGVCGSGAGFGVSLRTAEILYADMDLDM